MTATIDLTETQVFTALRAFVLSEVASVQVIKGQANRVVAPIGNFIVMTPMLRLRLATNVVGYSDLANNGTRTDRQSTRFDIQFDCYGAGASDNSQILSTLFRSDVACQAITATGLPMQTLYTTDPRQMAFISGEAQYEDRWTLDISIQINPTVTTAQQFADELAITLVNVGAEYPP